MGNCARKVKRPNARFNTDLPLISLRAGTDTHFVFSGLIAYIRVETIPPMNAEDQIEKARIYREHLAQTDRRRSTMIGIALAAATLASLGFLGFAFVQKGRADAMRREVERVKLEAEVARQETILVRAKLEACQVTAETINR